MAGAISSEISHNMKFPECMVKTKRLDLSEICLLPPWLCKRWQIAVVSHKTETNAMQSRGHCRVQSYLHSLKICSTHGVNISVSSLILKNKFSCLHQSFPTAMITSQLYQYGANRVKLQNWICRTTTTADSCINKKFQIKQKWHLLLYMNFVDYIECTNG